jgi:hypothetical protein
MRELVDLAAAATGIRASRATLRKALAELGVENVARPGPKGHHRPAAHAIQAATN